MTKLTDDEEQVYGGANATVMLGGSPTVEQLDGLVTIIRRLTAQGGDTELQQADTAHHAAASEGERGTGVGQASLPPVGAPRAEAAPDEIAEQLLAKVHEKWRDAKARMGVSIAAQECFDTLFNYISALRSPQPAPMGVDREALAKCLWDGVVDAPWAAEKRDETLRRLAATCYAQADSLIASGIVGKALPSEEELARIIEHAIHGVEWTAGKRPSIDDLEKMLKADETPSIHLLPDGSITAGEPREAAFKCARAILNHIKGNAA